jgi:hypothetical protein
MWVAGLFVACMSSRAGARALVPALTVERSAEALDCPDAAELLARVEHILGRSLPNPDRSPDSEHLRISVDFAKRSTGYVAALEFRGAKTGERNLLDRGGTCEALADAVSVTIALALDRELEAPAPPASVAAAESPPTPPPSAAVRPDARPPRSSVRAWDIRALVDGGPAFGFGQPGAFAIGQHLLVRWRQSWLFGVGANAILPTTTDAGEGKVRTSSVFGSVRGCYHWGESYSVGPCALFGAGRLRGVGVGYRESRSEDLTWTALGAGLLAEGPLYGWVVWGLSGTLWVPLRSLTFSVENAGFVWRSSPVAGTISLGVGVHFW